MVCGVRFTVDAATAAVSAGQLDEGMVVATNPSLAVDLERRVVQLLEWQPQCVQEPSRVVGQVAAIQSCTPVSQNLFTIFP
ncbi:hypothetical protein, partial [Xanthomonas fragariae]|uniref:hypothetical protein n=2 Tax=Xanthomonas fragariae TaxID=48664 RepID=UPI00131F1109